MNENHLLSVKPADTRIYISVNGERKVALEGKVTSLADLIRGVKISYKPNSLCAVSLPMEVSINYNK